MDSNEPDLFGQLPSVSENPSRKQSLESTGPTPRSTTMSEPSQQSDLEELTSSAEGSPASRGPLPGSSEAQKMTVTSGRSWLPLLKSYGLNGSLGRMCEALLTNRWASSAAFLTWKASGIKSSHLLFQLAPSMPRTEGIASGLWPTPATRDRNETLEQVQERKERFQRGESNFNLGLALCVAVKMWPTPTTRDYKGGRKPETLDASGRGKTNSLNDAVTVRDQHGSLNPAWVEWLMGFPEGWTDLKPSEMPSSRKSSSK